MPEISEVRLNYDLLKKALLNQQLKEIKLLSGRLHTKKPANSAEFQKSLPAKVIDITPRGKHLILKFNNGWTVWIGFGMSGKLTLDPDYPYIRVELVIGHPGKKADTSVYFSDMRNFANWYFWPEDQEDGFQKQLAKYGPDLLQSEKFPKAKVIAQFRLFDKKKIADALLDQKMWAGIGNYLRAEGMYRTKIYPLAQIKDLPDAALYDLFKAIINVAKEAYKVQKAWNDPDRHYEDYQEYMQVYQHDEDPLGNKVKRQKTAGGRTLHWVPEVQTIGKK